MEASTSANFENKNKIADSHFSISNQSKVEQLKENSKPKIPNRTESQPEN